MRSFGLGSRGGQPSFGCVFTTPLIRAELLPEAVSEAAGWTCPYGNLIFWPCTVRVGLGNSAKAMCCCGCAMRLCAPSLRRNIFPFPVPPRLHLTTCTPTPLVMSWCLLRQQRRPLSPPMDMRDVLLCRMLRCVVAG